MLSISQNSRPPPMVRFPISRPLPLCVLVYFRNDVVVVRTSKVSRVNMAFTLQCISHIFGCPYRSPNDKYSDQLFDSLSNTNESIISTLVSLNQSSCSSPEGQTVKSAYVSASRFSNSLSRYQQPIGVDPQSLPHHLLQFLYSEQVKVGTNLVKFDMVIGEKTPI